MVCNKRQTCNVCAGTFKMQRGCDLEKRCPSCRFLGLQSSKQPSQYVLKPSFDPFIAYSITEEYYEDSFNDYYELLDFLEDAVTEKELYVLNLYYIQEYTMKEIAHIVNVSLERVRQIRFMALQKLQQPKVAIPLIKSYTLRVGDINISKNNVSKL